MKNLLAAFVCCLFLTACGDSPDPGSNQTSNHTSSQTPAQTPTQNSESGESAAAVDSVTSVITDVETWLVENDVLIRQRTGLPVTKLPDLVSLKGVKQTAAFAQGIVDRIEKLNLDSADHQSVVTVQVIQNNLQNLATAPEHYWHGFAVTPYAGTFALYLVNAVMPGLPLATETDRSAYLGLVNDFAGLIEAAGGKTAGQAERGIRIPKPALAGVRATARGYKGAAANMLVPSESRLSGVDQTDIDEFLTQVKQIVDARVGPAYDAILAIVNDEYEARAPDTVGMGQYPGGDTAYRAAVRQSTSYDVSPEELHQSGLDSLKDLQAKMKAIRDELGFEGTQQEFHDMLRTHPRFIARSPAEVEERYMGYIDQIEPLIRDYFRLLPTAPYGVKRLDPAAEPGQTFGIYEAPSTAEPRGLYRYNGSKLDERPLVWAQGLIYHELIPGHHFQIALHTEMEELSAVSKSMLFMVSAYTEGWAEYASSLGMEMGLFKDPYDRYGRYLMESFLATRLVVDTGMNFYGWPLERARQFMRDNTFASETEIQTESLRYSTDIPAQALGYRFGSDFFWRLRRQKEAELGEAFDIRDFHDACLTAGGMPMWVLEKHVDWHFENKVAR